MPTPARLLDSLYYSEEHHWWSVGMRAISHSILANRTVCNGPRMEVGCGGGAFLREISESNHSDIAIGIDRNPAALEKARSLRTGETALAQADFHDLPFCNNSIACVIGLDAFDQQDVCLKSALIECRRVLKPTGILLLRVSAYSWLLSEHDQAFGTGRRYNVREISQSLLKAGFQIERLTHANILMLLPAIMLRIAVKANLASVESGFSSAQLLRTILIAVLRTEAAILRTVRLPAGLSIYALARKTTE